MIRRFVIKWHLSADERYLQLLAREGWTEKELQWLSHKCEALRVDLALCPPVDDADRVVMLASVLAGVALIVLELT